MSALKDDTGLTTTEYAVGTVTVAGLGGVLLKLLMSDNVRDLIWSVISSAFSRFFRLRVKTWIAVSLDRLSGPGKHSRLRNETGMATLETALMIPVLFLITFLSSQDFTRCADPGPQ